MGAARGKAEAKAPLGLPNNASTGRAYSGINILILWGAVVQHGFPGQGWLTYRQAAALGGNVRKGEHGTTVVYADRFIPEDEKRRARESGEEARPYLSQAVHRVQHGPVRGPARRHHRCRAAPAARPHRTDGRGSHQGDRH